MNPLYMRFCAYSSASLEGFIRALTITLFLTSSFLQLSETVLWICRQIDGETRIGIFTKQDVKEGTPLVYDYQ
jgi:hypothetical protein